MNSYQVGVAAEAICAGLFAWAGYDVSVKGSQDGGWGLSQSLKKKNGVPITYEEAANRWVAKHTSNTIVCLVQFKGVNLEDGELPMVYLATPKEIGQVLKGRRNNLGDTTITEYREYIRGLTKGTIDKIPDEWKFSKNRIERKIMNLLN